MTSDNTTHSPARGLGMHISAAYPVQESPMPALLPKRTVGASFWAVRDRPVASPPRQALLVAVHDGLRNLDTDGRRR